MQIVAVTADPHLMVALSTRHDLGTVRIVADPEASPSGVGREVTAAVIDLARDRTEQVVRRWRTHCAELPLVVVGWEGNGLPAGVHTVPRPLSVDVLVSKLREVSRPVPVQAAGGPDDRSAQQPGGRSRWAWPWKRRRTTDRDGRQGKPTREARTDEPGTEPGPDQPAPGTGALPAVVDHAAPDRFPVTRIDSTAVRPVRSVALAGLTATTPRRALPASVPDRTGGGDDGTPAAAIISHLQRSLGAETMVVWVRDGDGFRVAASTGLSDRERCVVMPSDHPLPTMLRVAPSVRLGAGDPPATIAGLTRLAHMPVHAVALHPGTPSGRQQPEGFVMTADLLLFDEDVRLVERAVADAVHTADRTPAAPVP